MPPSVFSITMAAGASSRMPPELRPKACCRIGLVSVIENALKTYEKAGISRHLVVVGQDAERVMAEVSARRPDTLFAFQCQPKGTGDAVRCALEYLEGAGAPEHVLISAGDKVIAPHVIRGLLEIYASSSADLCLVAGRSEDHPGSGRIILRDGRPTAIIEVPDISLRQLAACLRAIDSQDRPTCVSELTALATPYVRKPEKLTGQAPALAAMLALTPESPVDWNAVLRAIEKIPDGFDLGCGHIPTQQAADCPLSNLSVYVGRFNVLREAIKRLQADNAQGEWYFTDMVQILAADGRQVECFRTLKHEDVMEFNTPEQLEAVRKVYALRSMEDMSYPRIDRWRAFLKARGERVLLAAVEGLAEKIGQERSCILVRSPGRINLMGRHVDHQGGMCNLMAIDREIVIAAAPREDDVINLWNAAQAEYPPRRFTFGELTADIVWEDWLRTLNTQFVQRLLSASAGDWANYAKGAALRLQHRFRDRPLRGMDVFVTGNIPPGAGLSSSSALLVATAEALTELNALNVGIREFVDLCGEGEWFVGTRGGSADHAAIKFSRQNQVVNVSFFPFEVISHCPFPEGHSVVVCYSGIPAKKTESARARFNARVACYHMAREVIKREFPHFAPRIEHLRDVTPERLDLSLPGLYNLLKHVPNHLDRSEIEMLAHDHPTVAKCVGGLHLAEHDFPLRDVALYGIAECERARLTRELLQRGDMAALGKMMSVSHDGDRVATWRPEQQSFCAGADDKVIDALIAKSSGLHPLSEAGAALWQQPGAYACSTPEIDFMVDRALECPGVLGAQLAGAGLGGCIMVLVRQEAAEGVLKTLEKEYYAPRGIDPAMFVCNPSGGSQVLTTVEG